MLAVSDQSVLGSKSRRSLWSNQFRHPHSRLISFLQCHPRLFRAPQYSKAKQIEENHPQTPLSMLHKLLFWLPRQAHKALGQKDPRYWFLHPTQSSTSKRKGGLSGKPDSG